MRDMLRKVWMVLRTPVLQLVDWLLGAYLSYRGYVLVEDYALADARAVIASTGRYVDRSGHLNTVSKRRPRAVDRVVNGLARAFFMTQPLAPALGRDAVPPRVMAERLGLMREEAQTS